MKTSAMTTRWLVSAALLLGPACQRGVSPAVASCIDPSKINPQGICPMNYDPVCGCNGRTYSNACVADNAGVRTYTPGPCAQAPPNGAPGQPGDAPRRAPQ